MVVYGTSKEGDEIMRSNGCLASSAEFREMQVICQIPAKGVQQKNQPRTSVCRRLDSETNRGFGAWFWSGRGGRADSRGP